MTSRGDKILDRPLALVGGKGHFTKELEDAILENRAQMAVHSLKDVPTYIPDGLSLAAITKREDQSDLFLSHRYKNLDELAKGAVVGTTSLRRRMQLLSRRPDLKVKDLRGNINTRLRKLADGEYDAIILAYIGLKRLDLLKDIPYRQKLDFIPPMGQAALGIEIDEKDELAKEIAQWLNDPLSYRLTMLERDFVAAIGAGCSAPVAVNATAVKKQITIEAMVGFADGRNILHSKLTSMVEESEDLGKRLAAEMIDKGALEILDSAQEISFKESVTQRY